MNILDIFNRTVETLDLNTFEAISWMIMLTLLIWLSKEFKAKYQNDQNFKLSKTEKFAEKLSEALATAYQYKTKNATSNDFFCSVFNCLPFLNAEDTKDVYEIIQKNINEDEKVELLSLKLYDHLRYLSQQNDEFFPLNTGAKALEYIITRLKNIFFPILQAFVTFTLIGLIFLILFGGGNDVVSTLKVITFLSLLAFPFLFVDLFVGKKVNKLGGLSVIAILTFLILALLSEKLIWIIILLILVVAFFIMLFRLGLKRK